MIFCQNLWSPPNLEPHCETSVDTTLWLRRIDASTGALFGGSEQELMTYDSLRTDICYRKNEGGRSVEGGRLAAPVRPPLSDLRPQLCREELHRFILREKGAGFAIANFTDHNQGLFILRKLQKLLGGGGRGRGGKRKQCCESGIQGHPWIQDG
jgi:hypothetical protein